MTELDLALLPRWRGRRGRLEVHYLTATDVASGAGLWLHHEVVAPTHGEPYGHGWSQSSPQMHHRDASVSDRVQCSRSTTARSSVRLRQ